MIDLMKSAGLAASIIAFGCLGKVALEFLVSLGMPHGVWLAGTLIGLTALIFKLRRGG